MKRPLLEAEAMANALAAKLDKLEASMSMPKPPRHIPIVTTHAQAAAAREAAIAQGIDPDYEEIYCIRLVGVEPQNRKAS
jgi:hypothetical protein